MATVTIGKSYFDALLRRAEFHTSGHAFDTYPSLSTNVTISKAEHDYLLQATREYTLLKNALFRGGLTTETLETLLAGESTAPHGDHVAYANAWGDATFLEPQPAPTNMTAPPRATDAYPYSDNTAVGDSLHPRSQPNLYNRVHSSGQPASSIESPDKDEDFLMTTSHRLPVTDQRTLVFTNLSERTTHKDLVGIVRGGRLLDIFVRNDRTATVSFVEGAHDFLAYAKRNDIYLQTKRLEVRWHDRQFHVPAHVSNKIANNAATRNLVVRGAAGKLTAEQIRDHLDHIHNLVVIDISFTNGDAYISTNSIHNALFARTCMMSRTAYKGLRIEYYPDECAAPLPKPAPRAHTPSMFIKPMPITNRYTLLELDGSDVDAESSESDQESYITDNIRLRNSGWADTVVA